MSEDKIGYCLDCEGADSGHPECVKLNEPIKLESTNSFMPEAIEQTIATRGKNYGVFADGAEIMRDLKSVMHSTDGWERLSPSQQEALDMIQHKIGRVLNGKSDYDDNWRDIAGYATLVLNELTGEGVK